MKRRIPALLPAAVFLAFACYPAAADEMLKSGNMEDAAAWRVSALDGQDSTDYGFNYRDAIPGAGRGGSLHAESCVVQATNYLFWQDMTLAGGGKYDFTGAFADLAWIIHKIVAKNTDLSENMKGAIKISHEE
jgi:hypothetical protein